MGSSQGCECRCGQRSARETVFFQLGCHAYRYVVHRVQRRILSSHSLNTDDAPTHDARHPNSRPALELPGRRLFVSTVTLAHLSLAPLIHRERNGLG